MNRENLKRSIEEKGFDILYNAKQDYATYDILTRAPRVISLISITLGFLGLLSPFFSSQILSMLVLLIGVVGLHLDGRNDKSVIAEYENNGKELLKLYDKMQILYYNVKDCEDQDVEIYQRQYEDLALRFQNLCKSDHLFILSEFVAYYKVFSQHKYRWKDGQLKFRLRDKVPPVLKTIVNCILLCGAIFLLIVSVR